MPDRPDATGLREAVEALAEDWRLNAAELNIEGLHAEADSLRRRWTDLRVVLAAHPEPPEADPTAGEREGVSLHGLLGPSGGQEWLPAPAEPDADTAAAMRKRGDFDADGLVSAEPDAGDVEALAKVIHDHSGALSLIGAQTTAEAILASGWLAADRAATAERIAQAIERDLAEQLWPRILGFGDGLARAVRIARGEAQE